MALVLGGKAKRIAPFPGKAAVIWLGPARGPSPGKAVTDTSADGGS